MINDYQSGQKVRMHRSGNESRTSEGIVETVNGDVVRVRFGGIILKFSNSTGDMLPRSKAGPARAASSLVGPR